MKLLLVIVVLIALGTAIAVARRIRSPQVDLMRMADKSLRRAARAQRFGRPGLVEEHLRMYERLIEMSKEQRP